MRKPVIAIDGYSSTGKSSISKIIAEKLGLIHMDTGALYRGITWFALKNSIKNNEIDLQNLFTRLEDIHLEFRNINNELELFLNDENISSQIRSQGVADHVSLIACQKEIRQYLLEKQREIAKKGGVILDGRDIGTVILPNADYKFFLTASLEERVKRRYSELKSLNIKITEEEVRDNLEKRDKIDSEREVAPLRKADDAILIDNTNFTKKETIDKILSYLE